MQKQHVRESSTVKHPLYKNSPGSGDDIMLIKLPKPVVFSKTIEPICLPRQGQYFAGKATVAGWGMDGKGALPMKVSRPSNCTYLSQKRQMSALIIRNH